MKNSGYHFQTAVMHIFTAKAFQWNPVTSEWMYIDQKQLPNRIPYLILSATASEDLYKHLFPFQNVQTIQCKPVKLKGQIILHHDETYSRSCFQAKPELFQKLHEQHPNSPFITFKEMDPYRMPKDLHFGACQGHNRLQGLNIVVAGTPHKDDLVYKLVALQFGINTKSSLSNRTLRRNGFEFTFATYDDPELQAIQLYFIETDLLQAVGRARLIQYTVTLHLYSNYPLPQVLLEEEFG